MIWPAWLVAAWKARKLIAQWAGVGAIVGLVAGGWLWGWQASHRADAEHVKRISAEQRVSELAMNVAAKDEALVAIRTPVAECNARVETMQTRGANWERRYRELRARPTPTPVVRTVTEVVTSTDCDEATEQAAEWLRTRRWRGR